MPCAARLVNISTTPNHIWPPAWSGTKDKALVNFASAAAKAAMGSATKEDAPSPASATADAMSASTLSGSAASARSKKLRACARLSGVAAPTFEVALLAPDLFEARGKAPGRARAARPPEAEEEVVDMKIAWTLC